MQLPPDLSEGWYWVRMNSDHQMIVQIYRHSVGAPWWVSFTGRDDAVPLTDCLPYWTAIAPVALPSWETPDA